MEALGVKGAAIATLLSRGAECLAMFIYVYSSKENPLKAKISELFHFEKTLFTNVMKTAVPVILNESIWAISVSMVFAAYGRIGPVALAVVQVANTATEIFQTAYTGLGNASSVIVGQTLGQGKKEVAYGYGGLSLKTAWILNIVTTIVFISARGIIADVYGFTPETSALLISSLFVYALALTPKMLSYMIVCGILRAGGDTMYCMVIDLVFNMCIQVPLSFFAVLVLGLPLPAAIAMVAISDILKVVVCYRRFFGKKWINVFTGM
jgi:Na+-driven multidrug efflux pump